MAGGERTRLDAIVFGRPGQYSDAEVRLATERLQLLLADEAPAAAGDGDRDGDGIVDDAPASPQRRRLLLAGAVVLAAAAVTGIVTWIAAPRPTASLEVFSRAQTQDDVDAATGVRGAIGSTLRLLDAPLGVTAVAYRDNPLDVCLWVRGRAACVSELHFRRDGVRVAGFRWGPTGSGVVGTSGS